MTDTIQGIMMIISTIALLTGIIHTGSSIGSLVTKLHDIDPALISPYGLNHAYFDDNSATTCRGGILLVSLMVAIMSTIDSSLIQASATLLKDLYINYINPKIAEGEAAETKLPKLSLLVTAIFSVLVFVAAMNPPNMIIWLNLLAFGSLQAVFLWPLVLGLYWEKASATDAFTSMIIGLTTYLALSLGKPNMGGMHTISPTLIIGLIVFIIGSYAYPNKLKTAEAN